MGLMPYQLEKGLFPLALEHYFNDGLDQPVATGATAADVLARAGPRRRLRAVWRYCSVADQLRKAANDPASIRKVTPENSIVHSGIFATAALAPAPILQTTIARDWFGMTQVGGGKWERTDPRAWTPATTLGMWNGYYGNVELIVCETLQRMLEVSLGLEHLAIPPDPGDVEAQERIEEDLEEEVTRVWPVYLFLTCPKPWFEGWVTWQRHGDDPPVRGQVTVIMATPGHSRPVAPSPVDREGDKNTVPVEDAGGQPVLDAAGAVVTRPNPYHLHGRDQAPGNSGYEGKFIERPLAPVAGGAPTAPVVGGADPSHAAKLQGMWVVTHENHDSTIIWQNFVEPDRPNWDPTRRDPSEAWDLPPVANYRPATLAERADLGGRVDPQTLTGFTDIVVVQPASLDGGIP